MNEQTIHKFLSRLADQYGKNHFYIRNFKPLYLAAFAKVPSRLLEIWLDDYFQNNMPQFIPPLTAVKDFIRAKSQCKDEWFLVDRGIFCLNCRTDDDGKTGGFRIIWARFYSPKLKREINKTISARCDCESSKGTGRTWNEVVDEIIGIDPKATIRHDYYDHDRGGQIRATYQSDDMWEYRIKGGYVKIEETPDQNYYIPVWEHDYWTTSMASRTAKTVGWEIPEFVLEKRKKKKAVQNRSKKKYGALSDEAIDAIFTIYDY